MKLTKRGKRVRAIGILLVLVSVYLITANLWWAGDSFCWGSMDACLVGGL